MSEQDAVKVLVEFHSSSTKNANGEAYKVVVTDAAIDPDLKITGQALANAVMFMAKMLREKAQNTLKEESDA